MWLDLEHLQEQRCHKFSDNLWLPLLPCSSEDNIERKKAIRKMRWEILCKTCALLLRKRWHGGNHILGAFEKTFSISGFKKCRGCIPKHGICGWSLRSDLPQAKGWRERRFLCLMRLFCFLHRMSTDLFVIAKSFELPSKKWWVRLFVLLRICYTRRFLTVLGCTDKHMAVKFRKECMDPGKNKARFTIFHFVRLWVFS